LLMEKGKGGRERGPRPPGFTGRKKQKGCSKVPRCENEGVDEPGKKKKDRSARTGMASPNSAGPEKKKGKKRGGGGKPAAQVSP